MKMYTAHTKSEFNTLLNEVPMLQQQLWEKSSNALFMYLMKIRTGCSLIEIAAHCGSSERTVRRRVHDVRSILHGVIVPGYLKYPRAREELVARKSAMSSALFDGGDTSRAHLIIDGTYIYTEKSLKHSFQKQTYNTHKKRNYVKIMMGVSTDSTIIFAEGVYKATENDATIAEKIFKENNPVIASYRPRDILIVDRGFRDSFVHLSNLGFIVKMPACSVHPQLSTKEANESRLVTKVRFEVEKINGVMKNTWKHFSKVIETYYIPHILRDFEIGAALLNRLAKPFVERENAEQVAERMLSRMDKVNALSQAICNRKVGLGRVVSNKQYEPLVSHNGFPKLSTDDLFLVSFGPYQINQARYYLHDHLELHGNITFNQFSLENTQQYFGRHFSSHTEPVLIMLTLKSRFTSSKTHQSLVLIDKKGEGHEAILEYCCSCKVGKRTIGCCSHVMSAIYFLCFAVHNGGVKAVSSHLDHVFDHVHEEMSDDDEEEIENSDV